VETRRAGGVIYEEPTLSDFRPAVHRELPFGIPGAVRLATAAALLACGAGCDPILNIQGPFFPAWMLCMVLAIALAVAMRYLFVRLRLEPHLGPPILIYPSLTLLLTVLTWLALYRS
jgi:YtcA family